MKKDQLAESTIEVTGRILRLIEKFVNKIQYFHPLI